MMCLSLLKKEIAFVEWRTVFRQFNTCYIRFYNNSRCKYPRITVETLTEDGKIGVFRQWLFDTVTMYFRFLSCLPILLCCYLQKTMSLTKTFDWRFLQILYHSITTKVVAINIQALEEWYRTFSSITPLSLLYHFWNIVPHPCNSLDHFIQKKL